MSTISSALPTATATSATGANSLDHSEIASNFTQFLSLLTTQLKNQDPLSPMDTNQFTQQLVQFSQVEQQLKTNDSLSTLVSLQQVSQATSALNLVGATVVVNGATVPMTNSSATWTLNATKPSTATVTIADSTGQTVYTGTYSVNAGQQNFVWNGRGTDGKQWPDGNYTISATAVDASGQSTAITTQVKAPITAVDLTGSAPVVTINGQQYLLSQIQQVVAPGY